MAKGRKTGGRQKGTRNKTSVAKEAAKAGELPLDYMLRVMRDKRAEPARRDDMAGKAAPYLHARLATIEHSGPGGGAIPVKHVVETRIVDPRKQN